MKVFITGGTGFVGSVLTKKLTAQGHKVTLLTRKIRENRPASNAVFMLEGDPTNEGAWQEKVPEHDAFINLAGESIFRRWTKEEKDLIRESRLRTTENLVNALETRKGKKTTLLSTSAVGYYGFRGDEELDEGAPAGNDFLASLAKGWEEEALKAEKSGVRVLLCRFGIVMGKSDGALAEMLPLFRKGLGARLGSGKQWFSWIHQKDLIRIILFLLDREDLSGPFNCTAPEPVTNGELTTILAKAVGETGLSAVRARVCHQVDERRIRLCPASGTESFSPEITGGRISIRFSRFARGTHGPREIASYFCIGGSIPQGGVSGPFGDNDLYIPGPVMTTLRFP